MQNGKLDLANRFQETISKRNVCKYTKIGKINKIENYQELYRKKKNSRVNIIYLKIYNLDRRILKLFLMLLI